jgi:hypothetical protein
MVVATTGITAAVGVGGACIGVRAIKPKAAAALAEGATPQADRKSGPTGSRLN